MTLLTSKKNQTTTTKAIQIKRKKKHSHHQNVQAYAIKSQGDFSGSDCKAEEAKEQ